MVRDVRVSYNSDSFTGLRVGTVKIGDKKLQTPTRAIELKKPNLKIALNHNIKGINEIYKIFESETKYYKNGNPRLYSINDYRKDGVRNSILTQEFNQKYYSAENDKDITITFTGFNGLRFPDKDELSFLATRSMCYSSDIIPLPILPQITKQINIENYKSYFYFLDNAIEEYKKLNNKPLMGILPIKLGSIILEEILQYYLDNKIRAFCIDFDGGSITSKYPDLIDIYKKMDEQDTLNRFLYCINTSVGRTSHKQQIINAKDIISFGYGFDVLGKSQAPKMPSEAWEKFPTTERRLRMFDKETYGYHRIIGSDIKNIYPDDSVIPLDDLINVKAKVTKGGSVYLDPSLSNLFNIEQHGIEALRLREVISDDDSQKYIKDKTNIDIKDKKQIFSIQDDLEQKSLSKYF